MKVFLHIVKFLVEPPKNLHMQKLAFDAFRLILKMDLNRIPSVLLHEEWKVCISL
jgi:hypothetical protein